MSHGKYYTVGSRTGKTNQFDITLKPLCDEHLPLPYQWCADPEVLFYVS